MADSQVYQNPPAFPQSVSLAHGDALVASYDCQDGAGMSLRDYFAAHALTGLLASPNVATALRRQFGDQCDTATAYAEMAHQIADAMLKARDTVRSS